MVTYHVHVIYRYLYSHKSVKYWSLMKLWIFPLYFVLSVIENRGQFLWLFCKITENIPMPIGFYDRFLLFPTGKINITSLYLNPYLASSNTCVLWCRDNGLIWYCFTRQVFGWTLGVTYAWRVPYCPSIERIFSSRRVVLAWQR